MLKFFNNIKSDKVIWAVVIILSIFSILAVYSSTRTLAYKMRAGNTEYYLFKHFGILIFGLLLMYLTHLIKYSYYSRISQIALFITIPLLAYTLLYGTSLNAAPRWITLPFINLTFQTSDLGKLVLIMYIARLLTKKQDKIKDLKNAFIPIILPIIIVCGLILPANFSTAAILFVTSIILIFIGRVNIKYILSLAGIGVVLLTVFIFVLINSENQGRLGTWQNRIENFRSGESSGNYQVEQAKIAIARGGVFGKSPGKSTQRNFLPNPFSDFIYAIIIEEYGLIGGIILILLYFIIFYRGIRIVTRSPGTFSAFLTLGVSFSLVFQALINMAVAVNIFPVTGQALPLVSMGGTSIWFTSIAIGIILSVSRETEKNDNQELEYETA